MNPWIAFKMASTNAVKMVEVDDRKDAESVWNRFKDVEVSVGSSPDVNLTPSKISCGKKSYSGGGITHYK